MNLISHQFVNVNLIMAGKILIVITTNTDKDCCLIDNNVYHLPEDWLNTTIIVDNTNWEDSSNPQAERIRTVLFRSKRIELTNDLLETYPNARINVTKILS